MDTAIAVCLAESGGEITAKNAGSSASGLWQIMVSVHKDKIGERDVFDPVVNTDVAAQVWDDAGGKWTPWEVYTSGAYKTHLGQGEAVHAYLSKVDGNTVKEQLDLIERMYKPVVTPEELAANPGLIGGVGGSGGVTQAIADAISSALTFMKEAGATIGFFLIALVAVVLGVVFVLSQSKAGKTVVSVASKGVV